MENPKFIVLDVKDLTPSNLEKSMNQLHERGYKRMFESSIEWYQGKGDWEVIVFELQEYGELGNWNLQTHPNT